MISLGRCNRYRGEKRNLGVTAALILALLALAPPDAAADPSEPAQQLTTRPFMPPVSVSIGALDTDEPPDGLANLQLSQEPTPVPVPEPAAGAAWLAGIAALLAMRGRRREAVKHFT